MDAFLPSLTEPKSTFIVTVTSFLVSSLTLPQLLVLSLEQAHLFMQSGIVLEQLIDDCIILFKASVGVTRP